MVVVPGSILACLLLTSTSGPLPVPAEPNNSVKKLGLTVSYPYSKYYVQCASTLRVCKKKSANYASSKIHMLTNISA
jgi:hypothetical protein